MAFTSTEDIQTLTLPSTSAQSPVSTTITPQISSACFHQFIPLEVIPIINATQSSLLCLFKQSHHPMLVSYIHLQCILQTGCIISILHLPVTWKSHSQTIASRLPPSFNPFYMKFITGNKKSYIGLGVGLTLVSY